MADAKKELWPVLLEALEVVDGLCLLSDAESISPSEAVSRIHTAVDHALARARQVEGEEDRQP